MPKEWEPSEFERYWLLMEHIETAPRYKSTTELHIFLEIAGFGVNKRTGIFRGDSIWNLAKEPMNVVNL